MKRVLSVFLCIVMVLSCLVPTAALADTGVDEAITESSEITTASEPVRGAEIQSLREKNAKTYEMSDGTYQCVVYAEDIHYEDANGELKEIDNAIKNTTTKDGYSLTNTANSWHTYFADKLSQDNAVFLEKDDYSVSFSLPSVTLSSEGSLRETQSAVGTSTAADVKITTQLTSAEKAVSPYYSDLAEDNRAVLYKDVLNGVDISYTVKTGHLKEDIIIKNAAAPKEFEFKLNMAGVTPVEKDGQLIFNNAKGETVFELAPMYMEDANGKYSEAITYSLSQNKEGYKLKITADPSFFMDSKTVYPVIIDPSVTVTGESDTFDTCVDQQYPTNNYYLRENLWTGGKTGTNAMRTFIKFDLPTNIGAANVSNAYLKIKKREHEVPTIKGYRVTGSWTSSAVTWNNKPGISTNNPTGQIYNSTGDWYQVLCTTMVKDWMLGTYSNYGFCLKEPSENSSTQKTKFYSSDAPSPNKPELVINYSAPNYDFTMKHYLDQGYSKRFSNSLSAVQEHHAVVENILENLFSLSISKSYSTCTSYADTCKGTVTDTNLATDCSHPNEHLERDNIVNTFCNSYGQGSSTTAKILWTGHIINDDSEKNGSSASYPSQKTIIITPKYTTNSSSYLNLSDYRVKWNSRFTLLHETAHQLSTKDHYCIKNSAGTCINEYCYTHKDFGSSLCVMTDRCDIEEERTDANMFCTNCKSMINSHLMNHH